MIHRPLPEDVDVVELALTGMRRIAVVGLSPDPSRESHGLAVALGRAGWEIVPVNPNADEVLGERAYPDLASVPGRIDVVDVFRRSEHLADVARQAVAREDVAIVWNQLGLRSDEAAAVVADAGRGYVEDTCLKAEVARRRARPPAGPRVDGDVLLVDLDGTVLDYETAELDALVATLAELGIEADEDAVAAYRRINREHWAAFERGELTGERLRVARWEAFVAERGLDADGRAAAQSYLARLAASDDIVPGARAALWWLGRRARLVAVTNGFDDVQRGRLAAAGIREMFDGYVSSDGVGAAKPDPAVAVAALATLGGHAPREAGVVVIGDGLRSDVALGVAIGARTVWIADGAGPAPPDAPTPTHRTPTLADVA